MLKAYDFSKFREAGSMSGSNSFNREENETARRLVTRLVEKEQETDHTCTVCGSSHTVLFFEKWGVPYYRCEKCDSIFVKTSPEILNRYKKYDALIQLRTSPEYQQEESSSRSLVWEELVDWVRFRTFRYSGKNENLHVIDYGNRYEGLVDLIRKSGLCSRYELRDSILNSENGEQITDADIILYFNKIQQSLQPLLDLKETYDALKPDGLLFFSTRIGTGFDILTLKGEAKIFPYEHVLLPSLQGLQILLKKAGFQMLEYSTPGRKDIEYVCEHKEAIGPDSCFLKYMIERGNEVTYTDFQRFLQKSGLSSHAQIVAKKEKQT